MPRSMLTSRRARVGAAVAALATPALLLTGCGSSGGGGGSSTSATPTSATTSASASTATSESSPTTSPSGSATATGAVVVDGVTVTGSAGSAPKVVVAKDAPTPKELVTKDIVEGTGAEAKAGDTITANYVGVGLKTGTVFDSSWQRGQPIQFPLDGVIKGWQEGIPGMKAGGRRLLIIPAADAYGATPPPGSGIQPDEPLVFVVDLVSVP